MAWTLLYPSHGKNITKTIYDIGIKSSTKVDVPLNKKKKRQKQLKLTKLLFQL